MGEGLLQLSRGAMSLTCCSAKELQDAVIRSPYPEERKRQYPPGKNMRSGPALVNMGAARMSEMGGGLEMSALLPLYT